MKIGALLFAILVCLAVAADAQPARSRLAQGFESIQTGITLARVLELMGEPDARTASETLGVSHIRLQWRERWPSSYRYTVHLVAGYVVRKHAGPSRPGEFSALPAAHSL